MGRTLIRFVQTTIILGITLFGYTFALDSAFEAWKEQFKALAVSQGLNAQTLDMAFNGLLLDSKVLRLDKKQPEFNKTIWQYLFII